jgi:hypothetical protein
MESLGPPISVFHLKDLNDLVVSKNEDVRCPTNVGTQSVFGVHLYLGDVPGDRISAR